MKITDDYQYPTNEDFERPPYSVLVAPQNESECLRGDTEVRVELTNITEGYYPTCRKAQCEPYILTDMSAQSLRTRGRRVFSSRGTRET